MEEGQSPEDLKKNLLEYRSQLQQVEELLLLEENVNEELQEMYNRLTEVIALVEEMVKDNEEAGVTAEEADVRQMPASTSSEPVASAEQGHTIITPPSLNLPSILPASVAEQIRKAQIRAALAGQAPAVWAIGAPITALYSADGQWYNAVVEGVTSSGMLVVAYEGYSEREEVPLSNVKERAERAEIYKGVAAPKLKRVEDAPVIDEIPKWLEIKPEDDEKTKEKKKKLLKSYKSKIRFQSMDMKTKAKQASWQNFVSGKGTKKKAGFFTGRKKESMFAVPEGINAKVGVVGSGKGMTQYQKVKPLKPDEHADS